MKKHFIILLVLIMVLAFVGVAQAGPAVILDGKDLTFDVPPVVVEGRTMVPLRTIFEALGAEVKWDDTNQTVTAKKDGTEIGLTINGQATKNGLQIKLDVPAQLVNGRTVVPLRFVSEAIGCTVEWNDELQTATIKSKMPIIISKDFYENKDGKFSIKYPEGWIVKNKIGESTNDSNMYTIIAEPAKEITSQIISISAGVKGNFNSDDILKVYKIPSDLPKFMSVGWDEISRNKVQVNIGEAWLIYGKNMVSGKPSNIYIMLAFENNKLYQTYAWWNTDDWQQGSEDTFKAIVCSLKSTSEEIAQKSKAPPQNLSSALEKEFGNIEGMTGYKISDFTLANTIFVDFETDDYNVDKKWDGLTESTRRSILQSILNRLRGWFPDKDISIRVKIVFDYHTWSPDLDDTIISFDVKKGWRVSNTYYGGSANYFKATNSILIDPND